MNPQQQRTGLAEGLVQPSRMADLRSSLQECLLSKLTPDRGCSFAEITEKNIRVYIRARPTPEGEESMWEMSDNNIRSLKDGYTYSFDGCFSPGWTTEKVYKRVLTEPVQGLLAGYNLTLFAYGQTGSGKTFSTLGKGSEKGFLQLAHEQLFNLLAADEGLEWRVEVAAVEIFMGVKNTETLRDLLSPGSSEPVTIRENGEGAVVVDGMARRQVDSAEQALELFGQAAHNRETRFTRMNHQSSRSHALFTTRVEVWRGPGSKERLVSLLTLGDLAGSERARKAETSGMSLKEGSNINKSLHHLGEVITKLRERFSRRAGGGVGHVPYRHSKLTHFLKPSLGGNSNTLVFCTVNLRDLHYGETASTLKFATNARAVRMAVTPNRLLSPEEQLRRATAEIQYYKRQLTSSTKSKILPPGVRGRLDTTALRALEEERNELLAQLQRERAARSALKQEMRHMQTTSRERRSSVKDQAGALLLRMEELQHQLRDSHDATEALRRQYEDDKARLAAEAQMREEELQQTVSATIDARLQLDTLRAKCVSSLTENRSLKEQLAILASAAGEGGGGGGGRMRKRDDRGRTAGMQQLEISDLSQELEQAHMQAQALSRSLETMSQQCGGAGSLPGATATPSKSFTSDANNKPAAGGGAADDGAAGGNPSSGGAAGRGAPFGDSASQEGAGCSSSLSFCSIGGAAHGSQGGGSMEGVRVSMEAHGPSPESRRLSLSECPIWADDEAAVSPLAGLFGGGRTQSDDWRSVTAGPILSGCSPRGPPSPTSEGAPANESGLAASAPSPNVSEAASSGAPSAGESGWQWDASSSPAPSGQGEAASDVQQQHRRQEEEEHACGSVRAAPGGGGGGGGFFRHPMVDLACLLPNQAGSSACSPGAHGGTPPSSSSFAGAKRQHSVGEPLSPLDSNRMAAVPAAAAAMAASPGAFFDAGPAAHKHFSLQLSSPMNEANAAATADAAANATPGSATAATPPGQAGLQMFCTPCSSFTPQHGGPAAQQTPSSVASASSAAVAAPGSGGQRLLSHAVSNITDITDLSPYPTPRCEA